MASKAMDKTLTVLQPLMVFECAPPVDFLIKATLENMIKLSYKEPEASPIIVIMSNRVVT